MCSFPTAGGSVLEGELLSMASSIVCLRRGELATVTHCVCLAAASVQWTDKLGLSREQPVSLRLQHL